MTDEESSPWVASIDSKWWLCRGKKAEEQEKARTEHMDRYYDDMIKENEKKRRVEVKTEIVEGKPEERPVKKVSPEIQERSMSGKWA